jgi:hypothetical protein
MTTIEIQQEALSRARGNLSTSNYAAIIAGFVDKGIAPDDITPRVNVLTFHAWKAIGRVVKKGEKGIKVTTWIPINEKRDASGKVTRKGGARPRTATVFHISQTKPID